MVHPRQYVGVVTVGDKIYAVGGNIDDTLEMKDDIAIGSVDQMNRKCIV